MGSRLQQPISIASNIFATLPCPRHLARVFLCRALPCVNQAAARAPWRMTRDPLAVARDPLACDPRWPAMRDPLAVACLPLACDLRSAGRDPLAVAWRACPCPLPAIRRHPMADPASSDGRSGVIRWPIRRHPMADPMADPASSAGRSDGRSGVIRCLRCDQAPSRIRGPRVRGPYGNRG
jgi:hypothetical protein